jgi:hypothetical protein
MQTPKPSYAQDVRVMTNRKPVSNGALNPQPIPNGNQKNAGIDREHIVKSKMEDNAGVNRDSYRAHKSKAAVPIAAGKKLDEAPKNYATPLVVKKHTVEATNAFMDSCRVDVRDDQADMLSKDKSTNSHPTDLGKSLVSSATTSGSNPMTRAGDALPASTIYC